MLRTALVALAAGLAVAPAAAAADSPAAYLSGRTLHCREPSGSGPAVSRGQVAFATDYVHAYLRGGRQGTFEPTRTGVRFTSGPLLRAAGVRRVVGDVHPAGVTMPHDRRAGTRYQLVMRLTGAGGATRWYCRDVS